ncbi:MAG TPA: hypothetical protein VFE50_25120 [Cyclobacteriaceae bacterium]|nr:hypothetical protein [Cyclobacteriaceae bacterium]
MKKKKGLIVEEKNINPNDPPRAVISQRLLEQFERFYEYHPARRLSRNLRSMLLEFLMYDGAAEAEYLRDLMIDLDGLFSLLDVMEEESDRPALTAGDGD